MSEENTTLITLPEDQLPALYKTEGGLRPIIDAIKAKAKALYLDPTTEKGRAEIASHAYKIARTKTAIDTIGKRVGDDARKTLSAVNSERKWAREELEKLQREIRHPLTEYEEREKRRVAAHEERLAQLVGLKEGATSDSIEEVTRCLEELETITIGDSWEEFRGRAQEAMGAAKEALVAKRDALLKAEAERKELDRLRREEEERKRKEREAQIAREAAEKAKREAEAEAERKAEAERRRIEDERRKEREEADRKERKRKAAEEEAKKKVEREKRETEERHKRALEAERLRQRREAEAKAEAERKAKEADEKKAANKAHRNRVRTEAANVMLVVIGDDTRDAEALADDIIDAIDSGKIPNVTINY